MRLHIYKTKKVNRKRFYPFLIFLGILILGGLFYLFNPFNKSASAAPWSSLHGSWYKRKQLTLINNSGSTLDTNIPYQITIDTKTLYSNPGDLQANCNDLRIVYQPNSSTSTELSRDYEVAIGATDCSNSGATMITFPLQASISNGSSDSNYYMYYDNPTAGAPNASRVSAYNIDGKTATFVAPLRGTTTAQAVGQGGPTTDTGLVRYSGGKSALNFNGVNNYIAMGSDVSALKITGSLTLSAWIYLNNNTAQNDIICKYTGTASTSAYCLYVNSSGNLVMKVVNSSGPAIVTTTGSTTLALQQWYYVAGVFSSASSVTLYINGVQDTQNTTSIPTTLQNPTTILDIGSENVGAANFFNGFMDDVEVSNIARYTANFVPNTAPTLRDASTQLLFHMSENGADARATGKVIDDSGNNNNGTLTNFPTYDYVAGVRGVDGYNSTPAETGSGPEGAYASHQGLMFEINSNGINFDTNPSFENSTKYDQGYTAAGSNLTASVNTVAPFVKFGGQSEKLIANSSAISGTSNMRTININEGATSEFNISAYVYNATGGSIGGTVSTSVAKLVFNGTSEGTTTYTNMGGGWWRLDYAQTPGINAGAEYGIEVQPSQTIYWDAIYLQKFPAANSEFYYQDGSLGTGYSWSGTANNSTSNGPTGKNLQYSPTSNIATNTGTVSFWYKKFYVGSSTANYFDMVSSATSDQLIVTDNGSQRVLFKLNHNSGTATTCATSSVLNLNQWNHVVITWTTNSGNNTDACALYVNNTLVASLTGQSFTYAPPSPVINIGTTVGNGTGCTCIMSDFRVYSTNLTTGDIADLYNVGLGSHEEGVSTQKAKPILYWRFDENQGTTANDSSGHGTNGTLSNFTSPPTGTSGWQPANQCVAGSCLAFNGSNNFVSKSYFFDTQLDPGTDNTSISTWFRHGSTSPPASTQILIARYATGGYKLYMTNNGYICYGIDTAASFGPADSVCSGAGQGSYADYKWHQAVAVKSGTTSITLYIDGIQVAQNTSLTTTTSISGSSPTFYVGINSDGSSNPWFGSIDEVQVYSEALTSAQVLSDYNGRSIALGSATLGGSNNQPSALSNGLVGYWKLDESSGNAGDSSGNSTTLTNTNTATYVSGKFGNGGSFVSSSSQYQFASSATSSVLDLTGNTSVAAWINPSSVTAATQFDIAGKWDGSNDSYLLSQYGTELRMYIGSSSNYVTTSGAGLATSTWYHVAAVYNSTTATVTIYLNGTKLTTSITGTIPSSITSNAGRFQIAADSSTTTAANFYNGTLDEVRVYNRALSPADVQILYNFAPGPVGYWKFDEGSGSPNDSSGYINNGTLNGSATYGPGKFGSALKVNGGTDSVSISNTISGVQTVEFWVNPSSTTANMADINSSGPAYISASTGTISATGFTSPIIYVNGIVTSTLTANIWQHVAITTTTGLSGSAIKFGRANGTSMTGRIDDARIYNYVRTQQQIISDINADSSSAGSSGTQVGYWQFDEGYGTTAHDSSISNNSGTLTNMSSPATATSGWTNSGKFGKALLFNGTNNYVAMGSDVTALKITGPLTLSAWINLTDTASTYDILSKWTGTASTSSYDLYTDSSGHLNMKISNGSTITTTTASSFTLSSATWYQVVGIYNPGNSVTLYINGNQITQNSSSIPAALNNSTTIADIGAENAGTNPFKGTIDEVKVYAGVLAPSQILLDYNQGQSEVLGTASNNSSYQLQAANQEYCVPGDSTSCAAPVGRWDFEEGSGTTANDSSGNNNNGTLTNTIAQAWVPGKIGKAIRLTANNDYINVPDNDAFSVTTTNKLTISGWVKFSSLSICNCDVFNKGQGSNYEWSLRVHSGGDIQGYLFNPSGTNYMITADSAAGLITTNTWYHWEMVADTTIPRLDFYVNGVKIVTTGTTSGSVSNGTAPVRFGERADSTVQTNGWIDNVRIYNYARSPAQVAWDYNQGKPVGWWNMDECQGSTVNDSSGNGNSGTITIGASGTQTAVGTCTDGNTADAWYNGRTGKINYSLNLDGTDDKVVTGSISPISASGNTYTNVSWGGWFYPTSSVATKTLMEKATEFQLTTNSSSQPLCGVYYSGAFHNSSAPTPTLTLNAWNHVLCTYDGTNINTYLNGILIKQSAETNSVTAASSILYMGETSGGANFYSGQLDDIRLYNYPLTAAQVKTLYNGGSSNFAPATGAP